VTGSLWSQTSQVGPNSPLQGEHDWASSASSLERRYTLTLWPHLSEESTDNYPTEILKLEIMKRTRGQIRRVRWDSRRDERRKLIEKFRIPASSLCISKHWPLPPPSSPLGAQQIPRSYIPSTFQEYLLAPSHCGRQLPCCSCSQAHTRSVSQSWARRWERSPQGYHLWSIRLWQEYRLQ